MDSSVHHAEIASKEKIELARLDRDFNLENFRISRNAEQAQVRLNLSSQRLSSGWLSMALGTGSEKSGNIAGLVVLVLLLMMIFLMVNRENMGLSTGEIWTSFANILSLALGYVFGRGNHNPEPKNRT